MRLSCTVFELWRVFVRRRLFQLTPRAFGVPIGMTPCEFRHDLWHQKTRVSRLSCDVVCVILRLAVLTQYRRMTDTQAYTQTQTHNDGTHRASIASRGKKTTWSSPPKSNLGRVRRYPHIGECTLPLRVLTVQCAMLWNVTGALCSLMDATEPLRKTSILPILNSILKFTHH